tara:strand:+ start:124 stop:507 length:384 start_codon:yes stop_codon:yes gene_type:complete
VVRGTPQTTKRKQDSTGTESGSLADQFAPFSTSTQFELSGTNTIRFKANNDTSTSGFQTKTEISNNIVSATVTVGGNVFTAASIFIGGQDARPRFDLSVSDGSATTFWSDNNLDDTDNITITVTLTF